MLIQGYMDDAFPKQIRKFSEADPLELMNIWLALHDARKAFQENNPAAAALQVQELIGQIGR